MSTESNGSASAVSPDAKVIVQAINRGWVGRGFQLGIGFWLAGLFVTFIAFVLFAMFGAALLSSATHSDNTDNPFSPSAYIAPPAPSSDTRDWREQLAAQDRAAAEMRAAFRSPVSNSRP